MIELKFIEIESKSILWIWYSSRFESESKSGTKYPWIQTKSEKKSEFRLTDHLIRIRRICKRICFKFVPADHLLNFESKDLSLDSKITFGYATGKRLITLKNQDWLNSKFISQNLQKWNVGKLPRLKRPFTKNLGWLVIFDNPFHFLISCVLNLMDVVGKNEKEKFY